MAMTSANCRLPPVSIHDGKNVIDEIGLIWAGWCSRHFLKDYELPRVHGTVVNPSVTPILDVFFRCVKRGRQYLATILRPFRTLLRRDRSPDFL